MRELEQRFRFRFLASWQFALARQGNTEDRELEWLQQQCLAVAGVSLFVSAALVLLVPRNARNSIFRHVGEARRIISQVKRRRGFRDKRTPAQSWFGKKIDPVFRGYPIATVAFYGPNDKLASKIVVSVFLTENNEPDFLKRWVSDGDLDVRHDPGIGEQVLAFFKTHSPRSTVVTDRIIGCPHEEGADYPEGASCPQCPFWAGRDRFTHERIH